MLHIIGAHKRGEKIVQGYGGKARRKETSWKMGDGIKMDLRDIGWEDVEWFQLAQDRGQWRAVVNAVMNLRILEPRG
jgi:hypothetical protein